jgi:hypothetical protein
VGLYLNPPDNAVVVSVDEKSQIQALDRTAPMLPLRPGPHARQTYDLTLITFMDFPGLQGAGLLV